MAAAKTRSAELPSLKPITWLYIIAGAIAFYFSFVITVEKIALAANPSYVAPCSVDSLINCGNIMQSWQASLFGFPNPLLGIAGFAVILAIGFSMLSGFRPQKWFWACSSAGLFLATVFVYWLFHEAVFEIGSLCPYCIIVWLCTLPLFVLTVVQALREWNLSVKKWLTALILFAMYAVIAVSIAWKFWDYWLMYFY